MTSKKTSKPKKKAAPKAAVVVAPAPVLTTADAVYDNFKKILEIYVSGYSLRAAIESVLPGVSVAAARAAIHANEYMRPLWLAANEARAVGFVESAGDVAMVLQASDPKAAGDLFLKLASKVDPKRWGDKATIEHTGADGGPIESTVTLTPGEAYKRAMGRE
jgi:hypothetical protein